MAGKIPNDWKNILFYEYMYYYLPISLLNNYVQNTLTSENERRKYLLYKHYLYLHYRLCLHEKCYLCGLC